MTGARVCVVCGSSLEHRRSGTQTCDGKCRTAAWRRRKELRVGDGPPNPSVTVTHLPVTLTGLQGDSCTDRNCCQLQLWHASGPWSRERSQPRVESESEAA